MKKGQQFKIESIEELKEAYDKLSPWEYSLNEEINDFNNNGYRWIIRYDSGIGLYLLKDNLQTIPNPFKREKPEPFLTAMNNFYKYAESVKILIKVAEMAKERNELRQELNALRKEVEELKEEKPKNHPT